MTKDELFDILYDLTLEFEVSKLDVDYEQYTDEEYNFKVKEYRVHIVTQFIKELLEGGFFNGRN